MLKTKLLGATAAAELLAIEDVFSTYLYTGNGSTQTITNGIDLSGEGGLVWLKPRGSTGTQNFLFDTERGATKYVTSDGAGVEQTVANSLTSFNSNGFSIGSAVANGNGLLNASWTFRQARRFFDVVTYSGTGVNRTVLHDLGVVPGCIIIKRLNNTDSAQAYHRSIANTEYLVLSTTAAKTTGTTRWNSTTATATEFSLGTSLTVNGSGSNYVAYLFAHDPLGPSGDGSDGLIACDTYTGNGLAAGPVVSLGWEPQWLLIKRSNGLGNWNLIDNMRGFVVGGTDSVLNPNLSAAETTGTFVSPTATGFQLNTTDADYNANGSTYIYIAIRRGPMREPTSGTQVLSIKNYAATTTSAEVTHDVNFDVEINANRPASGVKFLFVDKLRNINGIALAATQTASEYTAPSYWSRKSQYTMYAPSLFDDWWASSSGTRNHISYGLVRAPGFFDVVAYTGTGVNRTVSHNLGVAPELMIVRCRSTGNDWAVYYGDNTDYLLLNSTAGTADDITYWNDTSPTATTFTLGTNADVNTSAATYIAYLFATLPEVSKVGSYTGNGTSQTINCGFTGGARFVLIKRTDAADAWYVWDTVRGIVSGNDPYMQMNSIAAEVGTTDHIDPDNSGFALSTSFAGTNQSGGSYIFLAIA